MGNLVAEAKDNPDNFDQKDVDAAKKTDQWFIDNGAEADETVLIEHG